MLQDIEQKWELAEDLEAILNTLAAVPKRSKNANRSKRVGGIKRYGTK